MNALLMQGSSESGAIVHGIVTRGKEKLERGVSRGRGRARRTRTFYALQLEFFCSGLTAEVYLEVIFGQLFIDRRSSDRYERTFHVNWYESM